MSWKSCMAKTVASQGVDTTAIALTLVNLIVLVILGGYWLAMPSLDAVGVLKTLVLVSRFFDPTLYLALMLVVVLGVGDGWALVSFVKRHRAGLAGIADYVYAGILLLGVAVGAATAATMIALMRVL
jgi:hypothetical protein